MCMWRSYSYNGKFMSGMLNLRFGKLRLIERLKIISTTYVLYFYTWIIGKFTQIRTNTTCKHLLQRFIFGFSSTAEMHSPNLFSSNHFQSVLPEERLQQMQKNIRFHSIDMGSQPSACFKPWYLIFQWNDVFCSVYFVLFRVMHTVWLWFWRKYKDEHN